MILIKSGVALLFLILATGVAFWLSRRLDWSSPGRRPHARHWITRSICGLLGLAIVITIAIYTIRDARAPYTDPPKAAFRVPTLPAPDFGTSTGPIKKGRFLLHVAIVTQIAGVTKPLYGETYEVRWPEDRDRPFLSKQVFGSATVDYLMEIHEIRNVGARSPVLDYQGTRHVNARALDRSGSSTGGVNFPEVHDLQEIGDRSAFFSIQRTPQESGAILFDLTPAREDDPLRTGSFTDFLAIRGADEWRQRIDHYFSMYGFPSTVNSPAAALIRDLGGILFFLLIASLLLAQLFRRRSLGFVKVAACLLLFVGALDRGVLRMHESHAKNASAPLEERLLGCAHVNATNFFRETALRDFDAVAADPTSPRELKEMAGRLADRERKFHFP